MKITIEVPDKYIHGAITSGFESGITAWCKAVETDGDECTLTLRKDAAEVFGQPKCTIGPEDLARGVQLLAQTVPAVFADLMIGRYGASVGDLVIQLATFGYLVFG